MVVNTATDDKLDGLQRQNHHSSSPDMNKEEKALDSFTDTDIETGKTAIEAGWDGPTDPCNPLNWSTWKKIFHTAVPALYGFVSCVHHPRFSLHD
jgi:hypothetical protein